MRQSLGDFIGKIMVDKLTKLLIICFFLFSCKKITDPIAWEVHELLNNASSEWLIVPSKAHRTIQSAINAAISGDTVIVQPGIYKEILI